MAAASGFTKPIMVDKLEWFASPEDLCRVMVDLHTRAQTPALAPIASILSLNPGFPDENHQYAYIAFKGGSEPGVLNLTFLMQRARDSKWLFMTAGWNATTQTFSTPTVAAAHDFDGNELANFYPSFSTDTSLLAFTRSSCSYDCDTNDQLLIVPVGADGGAPIELVKAEGSDLRNRYPNFSPFKEGGYHWMAFFSMRDYGWVTQGQSQRQIWVTAIDDNGTPTTDPSHPSFWLPGQDPTTMNDKAEWAALPCVGLGASCQGNSDCCDGVTNLQCLEGDAGVFVCSR